METQEISPSVLKNLVWDIQNRRGNNELVQMRLISDVTLSNWLYPGFLLGGAGKIEWSEAFGTYTNGMRLGDKYEFSKIKEIELSVDYSFKPIGIEKEIFFMKGVSYSISRD